MCTPHSAGSCSLYLSHLYLMYTGGHPMRGPPENKTRIRHIDFLQWLCCAEKADDSSINGTLFMTCEQKKKKKKKKLTEWRDAPGGVSFNGGSMCIVPRIDLSLSLRKPPHSCDTHGIAEASVFGRATSRVLRVYAGFTLYAPDLGFDLMLPTCAAHSWCFVLGCVRANAK